MKAFVFDPLWDQLITDDLLEDIAKAGIELNVVSELAPIKDHAELFEGDSERILCVNPDYVKWDLKASDYQNIPNLKAILGEATSYSWIDLSAASEMDIPVCNIRNFSTEAVAEWAMTMMFSLARQIPVLIKNDFPLDFDKDFMRFRGIELHGKKAGIVGLGNIGSAIAKRCSGLGMDVSYWSKSSKFTDYSYMELPELLSTADVLFPTMALNDDSKGIISTERLDLLKPSAMIVSVTHDLFDEAHVLKMVEEGNLYGYGFEAKPAKFDTYKGNVWAAPEYGWTTAGSMNNSIQKWVENMVAAAKDNFPNRVN